MARCKVMFVAQWYPTAHLPTNGIFVREHASAAALFDDVAVLHLAGVEASLDKAWELRPEKDDALTCGLPAMRNHYGLTACLKEAYLDATGVVNPGIPSDPELPRLLNRVRPIQEVVKVDYFLPGCPPPAEAFYELFSALVEGREPRLEGDLVPFD